MSAATAAAAAAPVAAAVDSARYPPFSAYQRFIECRRRRGQHLCHRRPHFYVWRDESVDLLRSREQSGCKCYDTFVAKADQYSGYRIPWECPAGARAPPEALVLPADLDADGRCCSLGPSNEQLWVDAVSSVSPLR